MKLSNEYIIKYYQKSISINHNLLMYDELSSPSPEIIYLWVMMCQIPSVLYPRKSLNWTVLIASNELKPIWTDEYYKNDEDDASITATNCNRGGQRWLSTNIFNVLNSQLAQVLSRQHRRTMTIISTIRGTVFIGGPFIWEPTSASGHRPE